MREINILRKEIAICFTRESIYKNQLLGWIIADFIKIITLIFVWLAVARVNKVVSVEFVVTYYLFLMLVSKLTSDYTLESGVRDMISGKFSNSLLKPFNYLVEYLGFDLGNNFLRFLLFIPVFIIGIIVAQHNGMWGYTFNFFILSLFIISTILGFIISFLLGNIISLVALKIKEIDGIRIFYYNISAMLSGEFIPIFFLSSSWQTIFKVLPFRYTLSFPVEILIGDLDERLLMEGFVYSVSWMLVLLIIYKFAFNYFIKYYESEGM